MYFSLRLFLLLLNYLRSFIFGLFGCFKSVVYGPAAASDILDVQRVFVRPLRRVALFVLTEIRLHVLAVD